MNIERFHNELAMRLGYERIVKDKRISISVEESDEPCVVLTLQSGEVIKIKASAESSDAEFKANSEIQDDVRTIVKAVTEAYTEALKPF